MSPPNDPLRLTHIPAAERGRTDNTYSSVHAMHNLCRGLPKQAHRHCDLTCLALFGTVAGTREKNTKTVGGRVALRRTRNTCHGAAQVTEAAAVPHRSRPSCRHPGHGPPLAPLRGLEHAAQMQQTCTGSGTSEYGLAGMSAWWESVPRMPCT